MTSTKIYGFLTVPPGAAAMNVDSDGGYDTLVPFPGRYPVIKDGVAGLVVCEIPATRVERCRGEHLEMGLVTPDTYRWTAYAFQTKRPIVSEMGTFEPVK